MSWRDAADDRRAVVEGERARGLPPLPDEPPSDQRPLPATQPPPASRTAPTFEPPPGPDAADTGTGGAAPPRTRPAPSGPRIGNAEREAAQDRLRQAVVDDTLTLEEFGERLALVLDARTRSELDAVVADLPAPAAAERQQRRRPARRWLIAVMGGHEQRGRWRPAPSITALALMGGVVVDLRDAEVEDAELILDAVAVMGGVEIVVPDGVEVDMTGLAFMGGRDNQLGEPAYEGAPLLRLRAFALMGGVVVREATDEERAAGAKRPGPDGQRPEWGTDTLPSQRVVPQRRPKWMGKVAAAVLAAGLLLGPGRAVVGTEALAVMGGTEISTQQVRDAGGEVDVLTLMGGAEIDLRDLQPGEVVTVDGSAVMGGVDVVVRPGTRVNLDGFAIMGGRSLDDAINDAAVADDAPVVNVSINALMGGVNVGDGDGDGDGDD